MSDDASDVVPYCAYCGAQRALLHCAQHAARLCLPCDLRAHAAAAAAARGHLHLRAPLCDGCHAAPAAAHCAVHRAFLCAPCARAAGCDAERHPRRPARAYTGFPEPAELARILFYDTAETADTWVPDLVNMELLPLDTSSSNWNRGNSTNREFLPGSSLIEFQGHQIAAGGSLTGDGDDDLFILHQGNWTNVDELDSIAAHGTNQLLNPVDNPSMAHHPTNKDAFEAPSPRMGRRFHHPLMKSCSSEPINAASTDAVVESMAGNNAAACDHRSLSSSVAAASSNANGHTIYASGMPPMLQPRNDEFHLGLDHAKPPSSPATGVVYIQDSPDDAAAMSVPEQASGQDTEAKTKQKEKRQEAKQRYKDKKNRRFDKQIMYVSRKVRADTRNRIKGRFAKASSSSGGHGDDQSSYAQCGDDDQATDS
ncbi:hypothetical protein HU200_005979 [Digitaria exilis]|uniref:CCT domain-containing protein n=1 Tax=Digitaria exilis TaxID=1010633 RepID=A0A835KTT3_9POAL|nr:hypothetical protein HU200_005979 [Digitaria exilis]